jgi:hypothetical protein
MNLWPPKGHHPVLAAVSRGCPRPQGRSPRVTHPCATCSRAEARPLVRLACVKRAASVRSEPGSNSQLHPTQASLPANETPLQRPTDTQRLTKSHENSSPSGIAAATPVPARTAPEITPTTPSSKKPPRSPPDAQAQTTPYSTAAACASLPSSLPIQTAPSGDIRRRRNEGYSQPTGVPQGIFCEIFTLHMTSEIPGSTLSVC